MRTRRYSLPALLTVACLCAISGCASTPPADANKAAAGVKVYALGELAAPDYQVVGRVWADSRSNAFGLPPYRTADDAVAAMRAEAARVNADGVINVLCLNGYDPSWFAGGDPAFQCYGLAIRVAKAKG
jgi:hypothetical protein